MTYSNVSDIYKSQFVNRGGNGQPMDISSAVLELDIRHTEIGQMLLVMRDIISNDGSQFNEDALDTVLTATIALLGTVTVPFEVIYDFCRKADIQAKYPKSAPADEKPRQNFAELQQ